jgi:hypothetical protein
MNGCDLLGWFGGRTSESSRARHRAHHCSHMLQTTLGNAQLSAGCRRGSPSGTLTRPHQWENFGHANYGRRRLSDRVTNEDR